MKMTEKIERAAGTLLTVNARSDFDLEPVCALLKEAHDHIERLEAQVAKQKPIIEEVAELCEYEVEYDGHIDRICFYCDVYLDEAEHDPSCTHLEAKAALIQESK